VDATLRRLATGAPATIASPAEQPTPAVSIRKSVTADHLICLDDGKPFKSLKRHLATLGMTPEEYRAKWGLPADYPMVAANYAARRSDLAKSMGLGQSRDKAAPPAKRGRKPKASA
jgi:predicted transcriptional regulator